MNTDFRVSVSFAVHPKTTKLLKRLRAQGVASLIFLWAHTAAHRWDGVLTNMDEEDIALAARWPRDPHEFVRQLEEIGFLDKVGDTYVVHGWAEVNPWAAAHTARRERAQKAARAKWAKDGSGGDQPQRGGESEP
jgi:hypothetical protein